MTIPPEPSPLRCSPLQLAWLHELGIEKPWLPAGAVAAPPVTARGREPADATPMQAAAPARAATPATRNAANSPANHHSESSNAASAQAARLPAAKSSHARTPEAAPVITTDLPTRAVAAAATDLDALGAAIAACQACGLCNSRHQVVVGAGVVQPAIMVIGEAPGEQEDRQGLPFVGRSGLLLDNMLAAISASRQTNVYVANAIKCRPPGNRNPRPEESAACHPYLMRQIELVNPRTILVLGRVAAQAVLATESTLQALRGQALSFEAGGRKIPLVVSYHPAYLLRRPTEKAAAWEDLQRARVIAAIGS